MKCIRENQIEEGRMLKMVGISIGPEAGLTVVGKYGRYLVKNRIDGGGNGEVFAVDVISRGELLPPKSGYVIKFLVVTIKDENEVEKRIARFKKEIQKVLLFQNEVDGVVPIYDTSIYCEEEQEFLWYLMPKAEKYNPKSFSVSQKLEHMRCLGMCIKQLHELGYAHRDIKPKNLLVLEGKVSLADFGLVWNISDTDEHITEVNDRLGPQAIRPPELQPVEKIEGIDYRKSDVYLYAKTIWMVLQCNNNGFPSEYSRTVDAVYISKEKLQLETAEPLHCLLEVATKHNYWERTGIEECINYIENQLRIIKGEISQEELRELKYSEEAKRIDAIVLSDEKIFRDPASVLKILNSMSGVVELAFFDAGKEYSRCPLKKARYIQSNLFEIEIQNPYNLGRKKIIELAVDNICRKKDMIYEVQLSTYRFDNNSIPVFTKLIDALKNSNKRVCLNAEYLIKMV